MLMPLTDPNTQLLGSFLGQDVSSWKVGISRTDDVWAVGEVLAPRGRRPTPTRTKVRNTTRVATPRFMVAIPWSDRRPAHCSTSHMCEYLTMNARFTGPRPPSASVSL